MLNSKSTIYIKCIFLSAGIVMYVHAEYFQSQFWRFFNNFT